MKRFSCSQIKLCNIDYEFITTLSEICAGNLPNSYKLNVIFRQIFHIDLIVFSLRFLIIFGRLNNVNIERCCNVCKYRRCISVINTFLVSIEIIKIYWLDVKLFISSIAQLYFCVWVDIWYYTLSTVVKAYLYINLQIPRFSSQLIFKLYYS